ncbi:hypothetical protein CCACVL1_27753, partial [Corchorus capsularis]
GTSGGYTAGESAANLPFTAITNGVCPDTPKSSLLFTDLCHQTLKTSSENMNLKARNLTLLCPANRPGDNPSKLRCYNP